MELVYGTGSKSLYEASVKVGRNTVSLCLWHCTSSYGGIFVLEHQIVQHDGIKLTQIIRLGDGGCLDEFRSADPYGDHLHLQYYALSNIFKKRVEDSFSIVSCGQEVRDGGLIGLCRNEGELLGSILPVVKSLGGEGFIYRWIWIDDKTNDARDQRCLLGCHPGWMHKYMHRVWYMNDPLLEHAKRSIFPATGAQIDSSSCHWACTDAIEYGFRHVALFPVHLRKGPIGLLQVAGSQAGAVEAMIIGEKRTLLRTLAIELFDWGIKETRERAASKFGLDDRELLALRMSKAGGTAENIATDMELSRQTVYRLFSSAKEKLGTPDLAEARALAAKLGLID